MITLILLLSQTGSDLKTEVENLKTSMVRSFRGQPPIYDPEAFKEYCLLNGAPSLFQNILVAMTDKRHTTERLEKNKILTVNLIYQLCFGKSQKCNFLQKDNGIYLRMNHITQEGIDTGRRMGACPSSRTISNELTKLSSANKENVRQSIDEARINKWLVVCIIDDYTTIHTKRRPTEQQASKANSMCTIVCRIFKDIPAIPIPELGRIHNPDGINPHHISEAMTNVFSAESLSSSYASVMPDWLTTSFFDSEVERHRLMVHQYQNSENVRKLRCFENLHLIEFRSQPLKSKENFESALSFLENSSLARYMSEFVVFFPGDWPSQYYLRQIVYSRCNFERPLARKPPQPLCHLDRTNKEDHIYSSTPFAFSLNESDKHCCKTFEQAAIPMIGPLHIALNAKEDLMLTFHEFFKYFYENLIPRSKLADKPKPWRTSFIEDMVYGSWTPIRKTVKKAFKLCRNPLYGIFLNLLDNYLPLVLSMYSITFRNNNFTEYFNAMVFIWVMFYNIFS